MRGLFVNRPADGAQAIDGVGHVGVDADRVEGDREAGAVAGDDGGVVHEQRGLRGGFFDGQCRAGDAARGE